jgi:YidC/Oxa1 family membrane protein insertase
MLLKTNPPWYDVLVIPIHRGFAIMHDDTRNITTAVILSMVFLLIYYGYVAPMLAPTKDELAAQSVTVPPSQSVGLDPLAHAAAAVRPLAEVLSESPRFPIETTGLKGSLSLSGLLLDDMMLKGYVQTLDGKEPVRLLTPPHTGKPDTFLRLGWLGEGAPPRDALWTADPKKPGQFTWTSPDGLVFMATLTLQDHLLTVRQSVHNISPKTLTIAPFGLLSRQGPLSDHTDHLITTGAVGVFDGTLVTKDDSDLEDMTEGFFSNPDSTGWLGLAQHYWFTGLIPEGQAQFRLRRQTEATGLRHQIDYVAKMPPLLSGRTQSFTTHIFVGPKDAAVLAETQKKLNIPLFDRVIDYGTFYFITKPLFQLLHWLYQQTGTMGAAILLLTVIVRLLMFPLANKSYQSMNKMKDLQPRVDELKARYSGTATEERLQLSQEVMKLYKENKVNPASGCLPMLLQLPVFLAMYKILVISLDMRHAPFWGWIPDLSAPDTAYILNAFGHLPIDLPSFLHIGVWPIFMGISMYISQLFNPKPTDKTQVILMNTMPIMMVFIAAPLPAGLSIYWTWSNLLSILQQLYIKKTAKATKKI